MTSPRKRRAVRLTKKRKQALHIALSLDDVLYERHRRYSEELRRDAERYIKNPRRVLQVIQRTKDGTLVMLQMLDVQVCPEGTQIIVGER